MPIAVLASGRGSNLQALMDAAGDDYSIACVVGDRADAGALARARDAGIPAIHVDATGRDRDSFDTELDRVLVGHGVRLVVLAGFMRVLGSAFVQRWQGRMLNVHPSLLPKYRGLHTHRRALEAGESKHGASVHFVTEELDGGPVVLQAVVPVFENDDAQSLSARVQALEHRIYPFAVGLYARGRLALSDGAVELDGRVLDSPLTVTTGTDLSCVA